MGEFGLFLLADDIQELFDEVDLYLESEQALEYLASEANQSFRNRRLNKARWLDPLTDSSWRPADKWRQVQAIVTHEVKVNGTPRNQIWITFSDVSKLGQRMKIGSSKSTPVGIFAFPIEFALREKSALPFSSRPYMHIFKTKKPHFEAGGADMDPNLANVKSKLPGKYTRSSASSNPHINRFKHTLAGINSEFNDFTNGWAASGNPLSATFTPDNIWQVVYPLQNWASNIYGQLYYGIDNYYTSTSMEQKIQKLRQDTPWLDNPDSVKGEFDGNEDSIREALKVYIANVEEEVYDSEIGGYKIVKKFVNVDDDLSANLSPEYAQYIIAHKGDFIYWPSLLRAAEAPLTGRVSLQDMEKSSRSQFDHYSPAGNLMRKYRFMPIYKHRYFQQAITGYIEKLRAAVNEFTVDSTATGDDDSLANIPYANRLKDFATSHSLNLDAAVTFAFSKSPRTIYSPNQLLYRVAQDFATQLAGRFGNSDWRMQWNNVLRGLGISSVVDTKNSGHVHSAEPTQGVFMDPKDIIHIDTIVQKTHSSKNDPANRPEVPMAGEKDYSKKLKGSSNWMPSDHLDYDSKPDGGMHRRTANPEDQRKGNVRFSGETRDLQGDDRFHLGLAKRVDHLTYAIPNHYRQITPETEDKFNTILTQLIKLAKAHNRLKASGYKPGKNYYYSTLVATNMGIVIRKIRHIMDATPSVNPEIKSKLETLEKLVSGESVKTPVYRDAKRPPRKKRKTPEKKEPRRDEDDDDLIDLDTIELPDDDDAIELSPDSIIDDGPIDLGDYDDVDMDRF